MIVTPCYQAELIRLVTLNGQFLLSVLKNFTLGSIGGIKCVILVEGSNTGARVQLPLVWDIYLLLVLLKEMTMRG